MPSRRRIQFAVPLVSWISGVNSIENSTCGPATTRAVGSGCATARYCATNSPKTIDTEVAIRSASANARPSATPWVNDIAANAGSQQPRDHRLGEVTGDQGGDRDAHLGAGELERQRAVRPLHHLVAAAAGAGVGVDRAALQRGQRELGRDEHRGAGGENEKAQQREQGVDDAHRDPHRTVAGPYARPASGGLGVGRLVGWPLGPEAHGLDGCLRHVVPFARSA